MRPSELSAEPYSNNARLVSVGRFADPFEAQMAKGALEDAGIRVVERVSAEVAPQATTERYLRVKREKMGHLLR